MHIVLSPLDILPLYAVMTTKQVRIRIIPEIIYAMYMYMKYSDQETPKAIQHNTMQLTQDGHFSKKNGLPRVGLKPSTFCILGRCSINYMYMEKKHIWWGQTSYIAIPGQRDVHVHVHVYYVV